MKLELMRDKKKEFPEISSPEKYDELEIWHCKYQSLSPVSNFTGLKKLSIGTYPDSDFSPLITLQELEFLSITHMPNITKLDYLSKLKHLSVLTLTSLASWDASGKVTKVESFRPLLSLDNLRELTLAGVVASDGILVDFAKLPLLKKLNTGNQYSLEQFAKLNGLRPDIKGGFLEPFISISFSLCKKCNSQKVMLSGVNRGGLKCPKCNADKIKEHMNKWVFFQSHAKE